MEDENKTIKRPRGKPISHPPVVNCSTGEVYSTYTEAGKACGGTRYGVMRAAYGYQRHHRGIKWRFEKDDN